MLALFTLHEFTFEYYYNPISNSFGILHILKKFLYHRYVK